MLMFISMWWLFILQIKTCGAMVKELNFIVKVKGFCCHICNLGLLRFVVKVINLAYSRFVLV
jgi:hypothetical protein